MELYRKYFSETVDENGRLTGLEQHIPDNFNFGYDVVDVLADNEPDSRALVWCDTSGEEHIFTFKDIKRESNKAANTLLSAGIKKGDRVMLALKRHYEYWFIAIALHKIGAVMIPVTHMLTAEDFIYRVNAAAVKAVICTSMDGVPERVKTAIQTLNKEKECILWTVKESTEGFRNFTLESANASDTLERIKTKSEDPSFIYFTSGTSGAPKGVIHDFTYPLAHFVTAKYWQQNSEHGLHFTISETGWAKASWGKLYGQWLMDCAVLVYDFDNFEPKQITAVINKYGVTSFCAPPTVYRYLTRRDTDDMPSLKYAGTAGEYLSPEVFEKFRQKTGLSIHEGYGQTETTLLIANLKGITPRDGSLGMPSPMYDIVLINKSGERAACGEIGEICIAPRNGKKPLGVFSGYLDDEARYKEAWRGGVYHTGDAAWYDEDGYFWFHGRFDDIIKSGGYRIGPYEVESVLIKHPAVAECSVIGVPDKLRGQAVKAVVVLAAGFEPTNGLRKEILEFCNARLAEYKWARALEFVKEMPKTISGKIKKAELKLRCG